MHDIRKYQKKDGKPSYTARIRIAGYPTMTATFPKKTLAQTWIQENESAIKTGRHIQTQESKKHTLKELIQRYKQNELPKRHSDQEKFKMHLEWWNNTIGEYCLVFITPALLTECKEMLEKETLKHPRNGRFTRTPATVNRYLATLSIVLGYACNEYGWLDENPMKKVRKNKEVTNKDRYLTPEEIERLLKACKEFNIKGDNYNQETYLFVLIAISTGARYSEIHNLTWNNVDLKHRQFYFLNTKNKENRGVPITDEVYKELKAFKKVRNIKNNYLWTTKYGRKLIDFRTRFYKVLELAKIENCRFHDLRHTVASHIAMNGGSLLDIAQVTGHKTMQMVKRYSHLTQKHTAQLLQNTVDIMLANVQK